MKKTVKFITYLLVFVLSLSLCLACTIQNENYFDGLSLLKGECTVTLDFNNGQEETAIPVKIGNTLKTPQDPEKKNFVFLGWYVDQALTQKYDFSKTVKGSFRLYAGYAFDAEKIVNEITTKAVHSLVKIYSKSYNVGYGESSSIINQGSGVCFHTQDDYYYILTNCHVAKMNTNFTYQKFIIEDYQGNQYDGSLYKNPALSFGALSAEYDLACLFFKSTNNTVESLPIADNPVIGEDIIAMGCPLGQDNAFTFGKVRDYKKITLSQNDELSSNVTFDIIEHNAYISGGSSGGPLLNGNLQVVGINYASSKQASGTNSRSFAIPAQKIKEFLNIYVYNR